MTESDKTPTGFSDEQRAVLGTLQGLLGTIGSANDAQDHGYTEDAIQMRKDSCEAIQDLMAQHVFLADLFPKMQEDLDTRRILIFRWADYCNGVDEHLKACDNAQENN